MLVEDLTRIGTTLDALVRSGANQLGGIAFSFKDAKPLMERARRAAVEEATAKARTLAAASGVTLGPVLTVQETGGAFPVPRPMAMEAMQARDVAISPGQSDVSVTVMVEAFTLPRTSSRLARKPSLIPSPAKSDNVSPE